MNCCVLFLLTMPLWNQSFYPEPSPFPDPEPYTLEWYYRLGDTYEYDKDNNYTFSIPNCGEFVGYYRSKVEINFIATQQLQLMCSTLYENEKEYLENRCETILVKIESKNSVASAKCKKFEERCVFEKFCDSSTWK